MHCYRLDAREDRIWLPCFGLIKSVSCKQLDQSNTPGKFAPDAFDEET